MPDSRFGAVENPMFQRAMRTILSITQANPIVVTTTFNGTTPGDHQYQTGLIARLIIPSGFGMVQANKKLAPITVLTTSTFSMDIDGTSFDPFVIPAIEPGHYGTVAQVVPVGEVNEILTESTQNVLSSL